MKELRCPNCGSVFTVDEADYASIVSQVKNDEFNNEVDRRLEELKKQHEAQQLARDAQAEQAHEKALSAKDKVIGERDGEILRLKEQLSAMGEKRELELGAAVTEKDKEIAALKAAMGQKDQELEIAVMKERQQAKEAAQAKDAEIAELRSQVKIAAAEAALHEKSLQAEYQGQLQLVKSESEARLRIAEEEVTRLKEFKTRLSTKMVGESLEAHCSTVFNSEMRPMFPNAYFEKDNDISTGSKGDFIFRDKKDDIEYVSIMFEMKNEMDETATKHKNEDFFKKLDEDRTAKGCEYAVLVSLLEPDSELYNTGIVDVSYKYPKMFVIRPQFFKALIMLLVNASKNTVAVKKELKLARQQSVDVTNFENKLLDFKDKISDHYNRARGKFGDAIKKIDETIKKLEEIKKSFEQSENYLRLANQDAEELTIRKLTYKNPTMKAKLDEARKNTPQKETDTDES